MVMGYRQKELISKQRDMDIKVKIKFPVKEGSVVEFIDTPEFNGFVRRISNDLWQTIYIDYGNKERSETYSGEDFMNLFSRGKVVIKDVPVKIGSIIEFTDNPQFNGKVKKIIKNKWQTVCIEYGAESLIKEIVGPEFVKMMDDGKITIKKK